VSTKEQGDTFEALCFANHILKKKRIIIAHTAGYLYVKTLFFDLRAGFFVVLNALDCITGASFIFS
jgi:hypothetical protein